VLLIFFIERIKITYCQFYLALKIASGGVFSNTPLSSVLLQSSRMVSMIRFYVAKVSLF